MEAIREMLSDFKDTIKELNKEINQSNNQYSGLVVKLNSFIDELNRLRNKSDDTGRQVTINTLMKNDLNRLANEIRLEIDRNASTIKDINSKVESIKHEALILKTSNDKIKEHTAELDKLKTELKILKDRQTLRLGAEQGADKLQVNYKWVITTLIATAALIFTIIQFFSS